jgi:hypothetical protein
MGLVVHVRTIVACDRVLFILLPSTLPTSPMIHVALHLLCLPLCRQRGTVAECGGRGHAWETSDGQGLVVRRCG